MELKKIVDGEKNAFGFQMTSMGPDSATIKIDDFEFAVSLKFLKISSEDEFLKSFVTNVNSTNFSDFESFFENIIKQYEVLMGIDHTEDSPLYKEGQQVFALENDNHDMKFTDRMRLNPDDFNIDLLMNIFEFLEPQNTWKLSRVCKLWYKLTANELIWKGYCKKYDYEQEFKTWKQNYFELYVRSLKPTFDPKFIALGVILDDTRSKVVKTAINGTPGNNFGGKILMTPSWDCTVKFTFVIGWLMFGFVREEELAYMPINDFQYSYGYTLHSAGGLYGNTSTYGINHGTSYGTGGFGVDVEYGAKDDVVGMYYDPIKQEIGFHVNGEDHGSAFKNVPPGVLRPFIIFSSSSMGSALSCEIIETPKKFKRSTYNSWKNK